MKAAGFLLLLSVSIAGQVPGRVIVFDRGDTEHCKVVMIEGRPMLQTVYEGTSVAVGLPMSTPDGDFRVFVQVRRMARGKARVKPQQFSALYSDAAHTRFSFYDKAAEVRQPVQRKETQAGVAGASSLEDASVPGAASTGLGVDDKDRQGRVKRAINEDPNGPTRYEEEAREQKENASRQGTALSPDELYLRAGTVQQGDSAEGFVYFRKPKGLSLHIGSRDLLFEVDIPVDGIVFRFS